MRYVYYCGHIMLVKIIKSRFRPKLCNYLNKTIKVVGFIIGFILLVKPVEIKSQNNQFNGGTVLVLSSYMSDSRRVTDFITDFENNTELSEFPFQLLMENLNFKGFEGSSNWKEIMVETLKKHDDSNLKGIILIGQEAWSTFLGIDSVPDVPFLACYVSKNGITLPDSGSEIDSFDAEYIDMEVLAEKKGSGYAVLNVYDVDANVDLILKLFPDTKNIAFLSDNSYGGVSMRTLVNKEFIEKYPELSLINLDGSKNGVNTIIEMISGLPQNTVLLAGTWRVDQSGLYYLQTTLEALISGNPSIPVFTMSGLGSGSIAIGGYFPEYQVNTVFLVDKLKNFYNATADTNSFYFTKNRYTFYKEKLDEFGIAGSKLPKNSVIIEGIESELIKYKKYLVNTVLIIAVFTIIIALLIFIYFKNHRLKLMLIKHKEELIEAKEKAEESDRLKSSFLANMSHEIRTPLNAIVGFSSLICDGDSSVVDLKRYSALVETNSNILLGLINDILDISRLDSNNAGFFYKYENIYTICEEAMQSISPQMKPTVDYRINTGLEPFKLYTDKHRLFQVLVNFLTNAGKYTENGHIILSYEVVPEVNRVNFIVTDTGCGIPVEQRDLIFDRFSKLDEFKQGTGLGLAICKQIAIKMGGEVYLDPNYHQGARFVFAHPIDSGQNS